MTMPLPEPDKRLTLAVQRLMTHYRLNNGDELYRTMRAYGEAVRAEERERCAKVCESEREKIWDYHEPGINRTAKNVCTNLAAAIRASAPPQCTDQPSEPQ